MIRVAHILQCMAERSGGPVQVARGLGDGVASLGGKVRYLTAASEEDMAELVSRRPEIRCYGMSWPRAWFRSPGLAKDLVSGIGSIDLLHVHEVWSHPVYAAAKIARRSGTPCVLTPHGELEPWRVRNRLLKHLKKRAYLSLLGQRMLRGVDCLHAITPREVDGFRRAGYRGPVSIVPNGIDPEPFARLPDPREADLRWPPLRGRRVVLFLARLQKEKGLDQLIPAWKKLTDRGSYDDAMLVLAGPDDRGHRRVVEALVQRNGVASRVLLTGMVRGQEKMSLVSRADVYTLPSYSEGFSMSVLENLAAGKPMLITPGCNFPEVAEAGAGLCVPPSADALAEALGRLLDMSESERIAMGRRGQQLVRRGYTWEIAARRMLTVYRCILNGREIPLHPEPAAASQRAA